MKDHFQRWLGFGNVSDSSYSLVPIFSPSRGGGGGGGGGVILVILLLG